ncbi:MAG: hypothetical protein EBY94_08095, partial [Burkholderiaceae bacterium]|nr:hypothetical protein [Burkholderiaceae bacterium]
MPELPEVEVTRLGIKPHLEGRQITHVDVIDGRLRWPVPRGLLKILKGQRLDAREMETLVGQLFACQNPN